MLLNVRIASKAVRRLPQLDVDYSNALGLEKTIALLEEHLCDILRGRIQVLDTAIHTLNATERRLLPVKE